ncbi:ATP-binding cassette domain-containing protein [Corynebacterium lipophiloflavum]|uniref:UvrABC system protein A n=1 Tax=Corynebacterium lipophiloflavum (strain ATCC 700352 / DSM 44291 / CCUG 37336 / JCM 10383 / DMMZ 1944) TaxID=525263 RepID=C0XQP7_CORLD|nr:excinuclease ABC subunit UvrA [Corynebacterium lipophiloflavum]EEI17461.1 putative excinuclease ABC, A subunit [Corynebacterium lipophiloflavum DSM 44291]
MSDTRAADYYEFIRVVGAYENNLKNVSLDIPKRRLTVFAGVSGSGKSSLVFDTIAAESRRLINETYSTFIQGFMPSMARPDVDRLEGLTTAIIVDQNQLGTNARSTVGTATDATAMLRVLFSRIAQPNAGGPGAYSFNVPSVSAGGVLTDARGNKKVLKDYKRTGGMCPDCEGTGRASVLDVDEVVDKQKSLDEGAVTVPGYKPGSWQLRHYSDSGFFPTDRPVGEFTDEQLHTLLYAEPRKVDFLGINTTYEGLIPKLSKSLLTKEMEGMQKAMREFVERAVTTAPCPACGGTRLADHALESRIRGKNIAELCAMEVADLAAWFAQLDDASAAPLTFAIRETLAHFVTIGLGYITLDRPTPTLSGGEAQRIKMIRHLGSALTDVTYVFDEPTAGLHPDDIERMNTLLLQLRDKGNTVLVVDHKPQTIEIADHVVELGPGAGAAGGEVVFEGGVDTLKRSDTITGRHLHKRYRLKPDAECRAGDGTLEIRGASENNLVGVDTNIPRGALTVITGVAGSGKSSLVRAIPLDDSAVWVDQASISGSRRSNPATYTGALDPIRKAFAKHNGVKPALFSPNSEGACSNCKGAGVVYVDLGMMQGVDITCDVCEGKRFDDAVLVHTFGGLNIAEVLDMPAVRAAEFFTENKVPAAARIAGHLVDVGLGYLTLGQPLTTLSGGERQRLKLASHLSDKATMFVLDEPTTGLHVADSAALVDLFDRLVDAGATVIVIEHNPAVIARADYIIDLGPGAGSAGGRIVAHGTPSAVAANPDSLTGVYLRRFSS